MQDQTRFAGLWPRLLALIVDFLLFCAIFFPVTRLLRGVWLMRMADHRWSYGVFVTDPLCLAFLVIMFIYFVLLEGLAGGLPAFGILGIILISTSAERARLGDRIAGTRVIRLR